MRQLLFAFWATTFLFGLYMLAMMCVMSAPNILNHQGSPYPLWVLLIVCAFTAGAATGALHNAKKDWN